MEHSTKHLSPIKQNGNEILFLEQKNFKDLENKTTKYQIKNVKIFQETKGKTQIPNLFDIFFKDEFADVFFSEIKVNFYQL